MPPMLIVIVLRLLYSVRDGQYIFDFFSGAEIKVMSICCVWPVLSDLDKTGRIEYKVHETKTQMELYWCISF